MFPGALISARLSGGGCPLAAGGYSQALDLSLNSLFRKWD